jgi:hypothetical protein
MLVGLQGFTRQGDDQLTERQRCTPARIPEGFDDPEADLNETDLENEPLN